ncbi:hypothetical protein NPS70_19745 [Streptomyces sp. C10-9-1]|uniref:hypothetical protein n=1 Tax=Streptomyces sp. C10-9-1 TaxID=1859285 RepID=UPI00211198D5|nr:hypothetical protein [Streptomyces sp. C10-9-1]MCQ6555412.1 hypothetical protein [Streptomyces sp. C10-9-1]
MRHTGESGANRRDEPGERPPGAPRRIELSVPQVAGSALAAVAAAVLASRLGVYGTIVGAGVVSIVATCGGPLFQHLFSRTGEQLRVAADPGRRRPRRPEGGPPAEVRTAAPRTAADPGADGFGAPSTHGTRMRGWKRPVAAAAVVFGVTMAGITAWEVAAGQELGGGSGTTVGTALRGGGGTDGHSGPRQDGTDPAPSGGPSAPAPPGGGSGETPDGTGRPGADPDLPPAPSGEPEEEADGDTAPSPTTTPPPTTEPEPSPSGMDPAPSGGPGDAASPSPGG